MKEVDRLNLSGDYIVDKECLELTKYHLCSYLSNEKQVKNHIDMNIDIFLSFPLKVRYQKKWYFCSIIKCINDSSLYWYYRQGKSQYQIKTNKDDITGLNTIIEYIINKT